MREAFLAPREQRDADLAFAALQDIVDWLIPERVTEYDALDKYIQNSEPFIVAKREEFNHGQ